jgi:hypothetical protein
MTCPNIKHQTTMPEETDTQTPSERPSAATDGSLSFDPADPEIIGILGTPCFVCGPIAHILKRAGHDIQPKAEDEQAKVIVWMIRKYQEYGKDWRLLADVELHALRKANAEL